MRLEPTKIILLFILIPTKVYSFLVNTHKLSLLSCLRDKDADKVLLDVPTRTSNYNSVIPDRSSNVTRFSDDDLYSFDQDINLVLNNLRHGFDLSLPLNFRNYHMNLTYVNLWDNTMWKKVHWSMSLALLPFMSFCLKLSCLILKNNCRN